MKNLFGRCGNRSGKKMMGFSMLLLVGLFLLFPAGSVHAIDIVGPIKAAAGDLISTFLFAIFKLILSLVAYVVYFGAYLVDVMLNQGLYRSVLVNNTAVDLGWKTVRDFCNMFYVFFLLLIAFATITRTSSYNAKSLMPKLIISLFLINFSMVITKIVIDFGQVFLFGMASWLGHFSGSDGAASSLTDIVPYFKNQFDAVEDPGASDLVSIVFACCYVFVLGWLYVILAGFLLVRLIAFVILIIVSPFAFFSMVLPSMRKHTTEWQTSLVNNAIAGPVFIFCIFLSSVMAKNLAQNPIDPADTLGDTSNISPFVPMLTILVPHLVAMGLLFASIPMAKKAGIAGSNQIVGGRLGIGKVMMGSYMGAKLAEKGLRKTGSGVGRVNEEVRRNSTRWNDVNEKVGAAMVKVPLLGNDALKRRAEEAQKSKAKVDEYKKLYTNIPIEQAAANAESIKLNQKERDAAKRAILEIMVEKGKTTDADFIKAGYKDVNGNFDRSKLQSDIRHIAARGGDMSDIYKQRVDVVADPKDMEKEINKIIDKGEFSKLKLDVMLNENTRKMLSNPDIVSPAQLNQWMGSKSQGEKDNYLKSRDQHIMNNWGAMSPSDKLAYRTEAANLSKNSEKMMRMANITSAGPGGINYEKDVTGKYVIDDGFFTETVKGFNRDSVVGLNKDLLKEKGHLLSKSNMTQIGNGGSKDQVEAIKDSLENIASLTVKNAAKQGGKKGTTAAKAAYSGFSDADKALCDKLVHVYELT